MPENQTHLDDLLEHADKNDHYMEHVSELGETEDIIAAEDIYSKSGVLLLKKGRKINRKTHNSLSKHKMEKSVDSSISIFNTLSRHQLALEFKKQLEGFAPFQYMLNAVPNPARLKNCLRQADLNTTMRNKLTIAYKSFPLMFEHAIRVSIVSTILSIYMEMDDEGCDAMVVVGLFHDLGKMHLDPTLLSSERTLSHDELKFVYAHPAIIYNILKDMDAYDDRIAIAVLEHHERNGGHGYPRGIKMFSNSYSAIIAIAEVLTSMIESHTFDRALLALRANLEYFDAAVLSALFKNLPKMEFSQNNEPETATKDSRLLISTMHKGFDSWEDLQTEILEIQEIPLIKDLSSRMLRLQLSMNASGIFLDNEHAKKLFEDPESAADVFSVLEELLFSLRDILREFSRQLEQGSKHKSISASVINWHQATLKDIDDYHQQLPNTEETT